MTMLETRNLSKAFGGLAAVDDVSLHIDRSEIVGLVGPNGAGKTTLFNLVTGFTRPTSGKIILNGKNITGLKPNRIARMGLARTFQAASTLFLMQTVLQNVLLACHLRVNTGFTQLLLNTKRARKEEESALHQAREIIERMGLAPVANSLTASLPHGYRRLLGVCLALATNPDLLLLDEPVTGLTPEEIRTFTYRIKDLREQGITILLVEHNMRMVMGTCDRVIVLNHGKKIAEGSPEEVRRNDAVIEAYLGAGADVT